MNRKEAVTQIKKALAAGRTGWSFVEAAQEAQIEAGLTSAEHYHRHLAESGMMDGWTRYNRWKVEHPDDPVPDEINRIEGKQCSCFTTWDHLEPEADAALR